MIGGFYSKLVRLKADSAVASGSPFARFYSKLVRLKDRIYHKTTQKSYMFLFQIGSIKSDPTVSPLQKSVYVSIPNWFD